MDTFLKRKNEDERPADTPTQKTKFLRKYNLDFIKYGFVNGGTEAVPKAQCVECGLMLSNEALKPSKLQRHLETKHPMLVGKPVEYFKRKEIGLQMQKRSVVSLTNNSKCALKASYLVARRVAQSKKAFTIAEELVLPAAVDMCRELIGEAAAKKLLTIPLSNDTEEPCSWRPQQFEINAFDQDAAATAVVMGTTTSEPCIYDKLSESIDILRQSGYRYGMSEREIERFIKQVLETNEPRREPAQFPILRATIKFVMAVGFLLVVVLAFTYPQSGPQLGLVHLGCYNWSSPLSHVRLLSLPIAKKYNLQGFHEWWSAGSLRQNLVNCSGCAEISSVLEVPQSLRGKVTLRRGPQLVLLKGGDTLSLQRQQLEELYLAHSGSMSILLEDDGLPYHNAGLPQGPANFTLLWRFSSGTREKVLRWLFPKAELCPLLDSAGTIVQRCLVTHSTNSQSKGVDVFGWLVVGEGLPTVRVLPVQRCQKHCSSFNLWLTPGDMVYADTRYWQMELFPGRGQNIICDGSAF